MNNHFNLTNTLSSIYLIFTIEESLYAIHSSRLINIIDDIRITKITGCPDYILGTIQFETNLIPVIDARKRLGMSPSRISETTCVIVFEITSGNKDMQLGLLIENEINFINTNNTELLPFNAIEHISHRDLICGALNFGELHAMLLDIDLIIMKRDYRKIRKQVEKALYLIA